MALLGKKCWVGPNDDTQPYEAAQAALAFQEFSATVRETSILRHTAQNLETLDGENQGQEVKMEKLEIEEKGENTASPIPADVSKEAPKSPNIQDEEIKAEDEEQEEDQNNRDVLVAPPLLPGCLDKNFKCPVTILVHDIEVIMAMGFTEEDATDALVAGRGKLGDAVERLVRSTSHKESELDDGKMTASPSALDLVSVAPAVTRMEQLELRKELKGNEDEEENEEEEPPKKRKPGAKSKAKAKAKAKTAKTKRGKATKPQAKAKAKAKAKGKKVPKSEGGNEKLKETNANGKKKEDTCTTPEQTSRRKTRNKRNPVTEECDTKNKKARSTKKDKEVVDEPKPGRIRKRKHIEDEDETPGVDETGPKTFARRYIPKSEPLRSVWLASRTAFSSIKEKLVAPSKFEDWFVKLCM